jgi:hypothetical protein
MIFANSPRAALGFLNLKSGFDSRRGHGDKPLVGSMLKGGER